MGRILVVEYDDDEKPIFEETMQFLHRTHGFQKMTLQDKDVLSVAGLTINLDQRKVFHEEREIHLTAKEFDILCMLAVNEGRVLTYEQIYQNIWSVPSDGGASRILNYHVRHMRKKLNMDMEEPIYHIRCVREVGYMFECSEKNS